MERCWSCRVRNGNRSSKRPKLVTAWLKNPRGQLFATGEWRHTVQRVHVEQGDCTCQWKKWVCQRVAEARIPSSNGNYGCQRNGNCGD